MTDMGSGRGNSGVRTGGKASARSREGNAVATGGNAVATVDSTGTLLLLNEERLDEPKEKEKRRLQTEREQMLKIIGAITTRCGFSRKQTRCVFDTHNIELSATEKLTLSRKHISSNEIIERIADGKSVRLYKKNAALFARTIAPMADSDSSDYTPALGPLSGSTPYVDWGKPTYEKGQINNSMSLGMPRTRVFGMPPTQAATVSAANRGSLMYSGLRQASMPPSPLLSSIVLTRTPMSHRLPAFGGSRRGSRRGSGGRKRSLGEASSSDLLLSSSVSKSPVKAKKRKTTEGPN